VLDGGSAMKKDLKCDLSYFLSKSCKARLVLTILNEG